MWAAENAILFGKYQLLRIIGTGRTCTVYLAVHMGLEEYRAIKKISKDSVHYREFRKEAVILKNLKAPGIPVIYDLEEDEENYYLIEEYLEGISLLELIESEGALSKAMTVSIGIQICRLVFYLHSAKPNPILYLDLQPKNLLLCHYTVKLVDFGQAVFLKEAGNLRRRYGTEGYAAPEQYTDAALDERTDIYAIGQIMHFLFKGVSAGKSERNNEAGWKSFGLDRIIGRCLETEKEKRYPSVYALWEELEKIQKDGSKNNKNHISSLIIAFVGNKSGVGTTHLAIGLSKYLKIHGFPNLYEEKNNSNAVRMMAECTDAVPDQYGIYKISGLLMLPLYGAAVQLKKLDESMIQIRDYGINWKKVCSEEADVVIMVNGGKWWDINVNMPEAAASLFGAAVSGYISQGKSGYNRCFTICNMQSEGVKLSKESRQKGAVYMKAPYFESPFSLSPEANSFYSSLMSRLWEGQHEKSRRWFLKVWLGRVGHFLSRIRAVL